jgi:protein tyrosine phosphatase (PTP) superfamily phosphohydrolase (DUF442 family)
VPRTHAARNVAADPNRSEPQKTQGGMIEQQMGICCTKTSRRASVLLAITVLFVAAGGGAYWFDRNWPWHHFHTVAAGKFYRAGQPTAADVRTAVRDYGVKTVVNLRQEAEWQAGDWYAQEVRATAEAGALHVDVPLACSTPPSPAQVEQLLAIFEDPARQSVLVHCEFGSVRSAAVEGLYRIEVLGESNVQALARVETWGHNLAKNDPLVHAFIRDYVPRRARPAASPSERR